MIQHCMIPIIKSPKDYPTYRISPQDTKIDGFPIESLQNGIFFKIHKI